MQPWQTQWQLEVAVPSCAVQDGLGLGPLVVLDLDDEHGVSRALALGRDVVGPWGVGESSVFEVLADELEMVIVAHGDPHLDCFRHKHSVGLGDDDLAAWPEDSSDLFEDFDGFGEIVDADDTGDDVEAIVGVGQRRDLVQVALIVLGELGEHVVIGVIGVGGFGGILTGNHAIF